MRSYIVCSCLWSAKGTFLRIDNKLKGIFSVSSKQILVNAKTQVDVHRCTFVLCNVNRNGNTFVSTKNI